MSEEERYRKTYPVSWEQIHRDCKALAWRLVGLRRWERLVGIARGGLVPAAIIARELDIHLVDTVCISSYTVRTQGESSVLKELAGDGAGWLVVDDLVDTGKTAAIVRTMLPKAHFACVYAKPAGKPFVDTFITEVSQDTWILFPWDAETAYAKPIAEIRGG